MLVAPERATSAFDYVQSVGSSLSGHFGLDKRQKAPFLSRPPVPVEADQEPSAFDIKSQSR